MTAQRDTNDFYPTPPDVAVAGGKLFAELGFHTNVGYWLDPAAGCGTLLGWCGVPYERRHAIEIDPAFEIDLAARIPAGQADIGCAFKVGWDVSANVVTNPPFSLSVEFHGALTEHRLDGNFCAMLLPSTWFQAGMRSPRQPYPDVIGALRWRPKFRRNDKGKWATDPRDVSWMVWLPEPLPRTEVVFLERPEVPQKAWDEFRSLVGPLNGY
jgi:hypothetical protein